MEPSGQADTWGPVLAKEQAWYWRKGQDVSVPGTGTVGEDVMGDEGQIGAPRSS